MRFVLNSKSGFITFDPEVIIYDEDGILFYSKKNAIGKLHFNLPKGTYETNNNISKTTFKKFPLSKLEKPNAIKKLPKDGFKIIYCKNPNKCSVDNKRHIIYFDNSFKSAPRPVKMYIKLHELGHYFYSGEGNKSEINCDVFAANKMLKLGYNPSQIYEAQNSTLSRGIHTSNMRRLNVYDYLSKK